jgi:hypothetical protein
MAPFSLAAAEIRLTASVGIAYAGPGEAISTQLMADADKAMYRAKRSGGATLQVHDFRDPHSAAPAPSLRTIRTTAGTRAEIALLVGHLDFEQARGILMEVHGITADEAFTLIGEVSATTGMAPQKFIAQLVCPRTRATALRDVARGSVNMAESGGSADGRPARRQVPRARG